MCLTVRGQIPDWSRLKVRSRWMRSTPTLPTAEFRTFNLLRPRRLRRLARYVALAGPKSPNGGARGKWGSAVESRKKMMHSHSPGFTLSSLTLLCFFSPLLSSCVPGFSLGRSRAVSRTTYPQSSPVLLVSRRKQTSRLRTNYVYIESTHTREEKRFSLGQAVLLITRPVEKTVSRDD